MGVVNNEPTPYCAVYAIFLGSLGVSNVIALLPLTIDRAVAVIFPLRHRTIITHKTCAVMFGAVWSLVLIVMANYLVELKNGTIETKYANVYHRCLFSGKTHNMDFIFLLVVPFVLIVLMYVFMLFIIVKAKISCGRFLILSTAIVATNILCFTPTVTRIFVSKEMSYKATQILRVTCWYLNGIFNPLIYFLSHPKTRDFLRLNFVLARILPRIRK